MALNWQRPGVNHVGEYQASGHILPIADCSTRVKLKYVAKAIAFTNKGSSVRELTFYDSNHNAVAFDIAANTTFHFKGKFLTFQSNHADVSALVELTNIPSGSYTPPLFSDLKH